MAHVHDVTSQPITGFEEYHILVRPAYIHERVDSCVYGRWTEEGRARGSEGLERL